jgi:small subunit ribosomal protein S8
MTLNNSINDSIVRIKNGYKIKKEYVILNKSKLSIEVLKILRKEGYIKGFRIENKSITVILKYFQDKSVIKNMVLFSPSDLKSNLSFTQLKKLCDSKGKQINGLTLNILSTSLGLSLDYNCLNNKSGGKLLLMIT